MSRPILFICLIMAAMFSLHWMVSPYLDGGIVYALPAFFDLVFIWCICKYAADEKYAFSLATLAILSILVNFGGYMVYLAYMPPAVYNLASTIIMICQLLVILGNARPFRHDLNGSLVWLRHHSGG